VTATGMPVDLRFVCASCGIKWFVPSGMAAPDDLRCDGCGGELAPHEPATSEPPPVWASPTVP
jgi:hypothetical protein